jgi:hypothetical protein
LEEKAERYCWCCCGDVLGTCRPSLGHHGDVDDGTVVHLGCCRGRVIPCGRRMGSSLLARLMAVEAGSGHGGGGSMGNE